MSSAYRDAEHAVREQLRVMTEEIERREASVTDFFWKQCPLESLRAYGAVRARCTPAAPSLAALMAAQESCRQCIRWLDETLARVAEMERPPPSAPAPPLLSLKRMRGPFYAAEVVEDAGAKLWESVGGLLPDAALTRVGDFAWKAEGRAGETPVCVAVEVFSQTLRSNDSAEADVVMHATTGVSVATDALTLRPEGWADGIFKAIHTRHEQTTDDEIFDGYFFIDSSECTARALLTAPVRRALLAIAQVDVPRLSVSHGNAWLTWNFEPRRDCVAAAVEVFAHLRAAPPTIPLRVSAR